MTQLPARPIAVTLASLPLILTFGCESDSRKAEQALRESLQRQSEQNQSVARQSEEVAEASRRLVAADAEARREIVAVHHDLQSERASLDRQHEQLEAERRELAAQRHRDPIIANTLLTLGLIAAALVPLVVAYCLLQRTHEPDQDSPLAEVLIGEIVAETPLLLPPAERSAPKRLKQDSLADD